MKASAKGFCPGNGKNSSGQHCWAPVSILCNKFEYLFTRTYVLSNATDWYKNVTISSNIWQMTGPLSYYYHSDYVMCSKLTSNWLTKERVTVGPPVTAAGRAELRVRMAGVRSLTPNAGLSDTRHDINLPFAT